MTDTQHRGDHIVSTPFRSSPQEWAHTRESAEQAKKRSRQGRGDSPLCFLAPFQFCSRASRCVCAEKRRRGSERESSLQQVPKMWPFGGGIVYEVSLGTLCQRNSGGEACPAPERLLAFGVGAHLLGLLAHCCNYVVSGHRIAFA